jgi:hypothetical protein
MIVKNPKNYKLVGFEKSRTKFKKYDAILEQKISKTYLRVPFGDNRYPQYKDSVPLGLYKKKDHNDVIRRQRYRARHAGENKNKFSSGYFSWYYLW